MMSRSLRSNSRWQKLQVQQIKQADNELRTNINNCIKTSVDCFDQREFLSLFALIPAKQQNGKVHRPVSIRKSLSVQRPVKKIVKVGQPIRKLRPPPPPLPQTNDDSNNNRFDTRTKRKITLESYITEACHVQDTLLARKLYLLNELYEAVADKRKFDIFDEQDKQRNIILKIMINELHTKLMFLRN
ncbi:uncharacterized protein LOC129565627 [Sitodiplosis mosellana]|uniref:uncharacterized protein LOC129565627 n=1 Tax=Sitodiplosis mosellana TaxID=263140 RepID=UPI002444D787|nr:uncharacterized protein LOC129565627 [Sitodiplosis mosellana]